MGQTTASIVRSWSFRSGRKTDGCLRETFRIPAKTEGWVLCRRVKRMAQWRRCLLCRRSVSVSAPADVWLRQLSERCIDLGLDQVLRLDV